MSSEGASYERATAKVFASILYCLANSLSSRALDPLELWEQWDPTVYGELDPATTWLQWSVAHAVVRQRLGLSSLQRPAGNLAYIFAMGDAGARAQFRRRSGG